MNALPRKYDKNGLLIKKANPKFSLNDIQTGSYIDLKRNMREKRFKSFQFENGNSIFSESDLGNDPADLFLESRVKTASGLATPIFTKGNLSFEPWSGDYWPTHRMGIAVRYADRSYPRSNEWKPYNEFFLNLFRTPYDSPERFDDLSPAEKYDILVGDEDRSLTRWSVEEAAKYVKDGEIETWMGLCHGWAPASYMTPIPLKPVSYTMASGKNLTFSRMISRG